MKVGKTYRIFIVIFGILLSAGIGKLSACTCAPGELADNFDQGENCRQSTIDCILNASHKEGKKLDRILIRILKNVKSTETSATTACYILGKTQSVKAIKPLIANLDADWLQIDLDMPYRMVHPSQALIDIGEPCLPSLIRSVGKFQEDGIHFLMAGIIYHVKGGKEAALDFLRKLSSTAKKKHKPGINTLMEILKNQFRN